jgi:RNA polymerase sigma-70 factor (ECF subfamily)
MARVRQHDDTAFEALVRRHEDRVFALAYRVLQDKEEARDVAQEVFIGIWENPRAWKSVGQTFLSVHLPLKGGIEGEVVSAKKASLPAKFTTWLYRITMNRALNRRRMLKVKAFLRLSDYDPDDLPIPDPSPAPDEQLDDAERQRVFERAFQRLLPRQRAALHLRYREELSVAEVARALGVSVKSAESLIFRGKAALRSKVR